jgi:GDP-mannose 6-dehydrogenase
MKLVVIGAGYVGCVSAACLAKLGHDVVVVDTDSFKVGELLAGRSPVVEPGLNALIAAMVSAGRLRAALPSDELLLAATVAIVCVSTPSLKAGDVDTRPVQRVFGAIERVVPLRSSPLVVIVRSTIVPSKLREITGGLGSDVARNLRIVVNPEFLRETSAIADFEHPPFVLLGSDDPKAIEVVAELYAKINAPLYKLDIETALLVKYASNAYHAMKIAFANEMATVTEAVGGDPRTVMSIFIEDRILNVSSAYLRPGFAFGGSCLPKDVRALLALGKASGESLPLLRGVLDSNRCRIERAADIIAATGPRRLAMLGISFKCGTDDLRESPYLMLARQLVHRGIVIRIYDPDIDADRLVGANRQYALEQLPELLQMLVGCVDVALESADAVVLCKRLLDHAALARLTEAIRVFDLEYLL